MAGAPARGGSPSSPAASVIVPSWNGARYLPTCLSALRKQTAVDFETIVVDNGSQDDTPQVLAAFPEVRWLRLATNRGFARAANVGIGAASAPFVVLLNNDTEVEPGWLAALIAAFDACPDVGMTTSKVRLFDRRDVLHTTGDIVDLAGWAHNRGFGQVDQGQWDGQPEVFAANAAAAAYRRAMLEEIGLFAEAFGSYLEDVDLAWRGQLAGWRCRFVPQAVVYHHLSATGGGCTASYLVARNRVWLIARNYPSGLLMRHWPAILAGQWRAASAALAAWRGREARATLRGLCVGWLTWPRMLPARRAIQSRRRLPDADLESWLRAASIRAAG